MGDSGVSRSTSRAKLSEYYGLDNETEESSTQKNPPKRKTSSKSNHSRNSSSVVNPLDINGSEFDPDMFVNKLVAEASLAQLLAQEGEIVRQIQGLDSDMQTLVYENYNKFIAATETIRKMRVDFRGMEEEMEQLASSMSSITQFSNQVSDSLRHNRQEVARLSSAHNTLQGLEFILSLPERLESSISEGCLAQAVSDWKGGEASLSQYRDLPSFSGIQEDCERIMAGLRQSLESRLADPACEGEQLTQAVELLRELGCPSEELSCSYLQHASISLEQHLEALEAQAALAAADAPVDLMDPLEFVDLACNQFLGELCLSCTGYCATFPDSSPASPLTAWVEDLVLRFSGAVSGRLSCPAAQELGDSPLLVRAVDRLHRRLAANSRLVPGAELGMVGLDIVLTVSTSFCQASCTHLDIKLEELLLSVRQAIAQPRRGGEGGPHLQELGTQLLKALTDNVKEVLETLSTFLEPDLSFSSLPSFRGKFISLVREQVFIQHFRHILDTCQQFSGSRSVPPALLLLLSRSCHDLEVSVTGHLHSHLSDLFSQQPDSASHRSLASLNQSLVSVSSALLSSYVSVCGAELSTMLAKSVEARDWRGATEPRSVRAVMKRVVEDVTHIDEQVGQLYEEGQRKVRSSDSSRTYGTAHRSRSLISSTTLDTSLASNIQRLFSEKIDYFSPVQPNRVSVLTGIVKLGLKTFLECVRMQTFAKYGLQQMQVDCHYLQLYLWRFVSDEAVVAQLLDEVLSSALQRSLTHPPTLMEASVVEVICDKGG